MKSPLIKIFLMMLIATMGIAIGLGFVSQIINLIIIRNVGVTTYARVGMLWNFFMMILKGGIVGIVLALIARPHRHDNIFNSVLGYGIAGSLVAQYIMPLYTYARYIKYTTDYGTSEILSLREFYTNYLFSSIIFNVIFVIVIVITVPVFYKLRGDGRKVQRKKSTLFRI